MPDLIYEGGENQRPPPPLSSPTTAILIFASALILSSSLYLLLRCLSRSRHRTFAAADDANNRRDSRRRDISSVDDSKMPLFTFNSLAGKLAANGGDCAVCLSRFEATDRLRLLPLCCHAFHAECIDAWLSSNQTCPLCRSTVHPADSDALDKILPSDERSSSFSFRVEIGSVSQRQGSEADSGNHLRSYSIGAFDYIVDDGGYEVSVGSTAHRRGNSSVDKESVGVSSSESLAGEVSGRSWLRDYAASFRSSGWFGGGSSRWSDVVVGGGGYLEGNRIGDDVSEFFRWLSGV